MCKAYRTIICICPDRQYIIISKKCDQQIWGFVLRQKGRLLRGGSWNNKARNCRSANRNRNRPDKRNNNLGFRLAASLSSTH
ncbi:MAG: SUMF1/EgtB/PvdO family nonheme iron enzyme [Candidatus Magnetomorum sp.]|nr:SUMF1/EgtB/PvdO family nonheme iron enzyme [Candidatus Magnetomorum sp.]